MASIWRLELDELGAQALGLLAGLGADVVGVDDGAQALGRADGLEPGHADAQDEHVGGLGRARGGGQQREVARVRVGRDEDRLVAADVGLRRERVHRLGARQRARDGVEADGRHAGIGQGLGALRVDERLEQARGRPGPRRSFEASAADGLATRRTTSACWYSWSRRDDGRAGLGVRAVGDGRAGTGALLDEDLQPGLLQLAERFGYQGDAPLSGRGLLGDTDLHGHHLFTWR